ncbi:MAG: hypothetical protein LAP21_25915, partial [Acidobacteriia bacterium]|nr:hypothetical protein [Terriglobia bacterium]
DELSSYADRVQEEILQEPEKVMLDSISLSTLIKSDPLVLYLDKSIADLAGVELEERSVESVQKLVHELLYAGLSTVSDLRCAMEPRKELLIAQYKERLRQRSRPLLSVHKGICIFQLFQIVIAEQRGAECLKQALEQFDIDMPQNRDSGAKQVMAILQGLTKK